MSTVIAKPWYRHVWPWLLIIPPLGAVIGGGVTLYLAITRPDALVRKDCVRDGVTMVCGEDARRPQRDDAGQDTTQPAQ
jgi:hypothetical protein